VAASLFQAPPNGTFEGALVHFLMAEKYRGDDNPWKDNKLFVAKCHVQLNNLPEAVKWLDLATAVPTKSADVIILLLNLFNLVINYSCRTKRVKSKSRCYSPNIMATGGRNVFPFTVLRSA
jgi:hypothetical protein